MRNTITALSITAVMALFVSSATQQSASADEDQLMRRIQQLENRIIELEGNAAKNELSVPSAELPAKTLDFLGQTEISGFVSLSLFHNFNNGSPVNLNYITADDELMVNKFKIALENPIEASADVWDAGYRADLIFGQDASLLSGGGMHALSLGTGSTTTGGFVEQAYVAINVPVGNGLEVRVGQFVTLIGLEAIEETVNPNWTLGNQWIYVEPFTHPGIALNYKWNDTIDTQLAIYNGWDVLPDNNNARSVMGRMGIAINEKTTLGLVGYAGPEQSGNNSNLRAGGEVTLIHECSDKLTTYVQIDYGHEENVAGAGANAEWYAAGLWMVYQKDENIGFATRIDYLKDVDSTRTGFDMTGDTELVSLTGTLNLTPVENLQIRPELRWDHSSENVFSTHDDQVTAGVGIAYLY